MKLAALTCAIFTILQLLIEVKGQEESRGNLTTAGTRPSERRSDHSGLRPDNSDLRSRHSGLRPGSSDLRPSQGEPQPDVNRSKRLTGSQLTEHNEGTSYSYQEINHNSQYSQYEQALIDKKKYENKQNYLKPAQMKKENYKRLREKEQGRANEQGRPQEESRTKRLTVPSYTAPNNYSGPGNEYGSIKAYTVDDSEITPDSRLTQSQFAGMGFEHNVRTIGHRANNTKQDQASYDVGGDKVKFEGELVDETGYEKLSQMDQLNFDNAQNLEDDIGNHFEQSEDNGHFPQDIYSDQVEFEGHFDAQKHAREAMKHFSVLNTYDPKEQAKTPEKGQKGREIAFQGQNNAASYDTGHDSGNEGHEEVNVQGYHGQDNQGQEEVNNTEGTKEEVFDGGKGHGGGGGGGGGGHVEYQAGHSIRIVKVPHIIKYTVIKKVPYRVEIPVPAPYGVPYSVPREVFVKKPVQIEVYKPYVVHVGKPYHITEHKLVEVPVVKKIPYTVHKTIKVPYAHKIYVKKPIYITKHSSGGHKG